MNNQSEHINCLKFKSGHKIAAYDIDFYGVDRKVASSSTSSSNDNLHQKSAEFNVAAIALEANGNNLYFNTKSCVISYKSKWFVIIAFGLLAFTMLPLQYQTENFLIQIKKLQDSCAESQGFFNQNQTHIFDTIFPYGFSSGLRFEGLPKQANTANNYTIKYLSQADCRLRNLSSFLNILTAPLTDTSPFISSLKIASNIDSMKRPKSFIFICDDQLFKKSRQFGYFADATVETRTNMLTQVSHLCFKQI